jgi:predicted ATP-grasp superfamily ATP-dependent carboligase
VCYLDLTQQPVPACTPAIGRKWMLEDDIFAAVRSAREGQLTFKQWLQSVRGIRETHWFAPDDPAPGFVWLWKALWPRVVSRL